MKTQIKYMIAGLVLGGILPALLHHPLNITIFASMGDITAHVIGGLIGISISLLVWRLNSRVKR